MNRESRSEGLEKDFDLTPEEEMAFRRLPREAEASELLEERIVRSLRQEGMIREDGGKGMAPGDRGAGPPGIWVRPWMAVAAVAAALAFFASGMVMGQWMGTRSTAEAFLAVREQDAQQLAMTIQETGSQYVSALAALSEMRTDVSEREGGGGAPPPSVEQLRQGREVAMGTLYGAAYELARMSPDDLDVLRVLEILEERREGEEGGTGAVRNVVWF